MLYLSAPRDNIKQMKITIPVPMVAPMATENHFIYILFFR